MRVISCLLAALAAALVWTPAAPADVFFFTTGDPDYRMATGARPDSYGINEIESADDFILSDRTVLYNATFWGLLPPDATLDDIQDVVVEIYRVFPNDSDTSRTPQVPTRTNSPSDVEFDDRSYSGGDLTYTVYLIDPYSGADNSVVTGIYPSPDQTTGGDGPVYGQSVFIDVTFTVPFDLPPDHYFFVPQVGLNGDGAFLWLSAPHPQFTGDLQMWIRNSGLDPDWLRVGTDIVGGTPPPTFNGTLTLLGETIPEMGP